MTNRVNLTPLDSLLKVQKIKYFYLIIPIILILGSFIASFIFRSFLYDRYISILGLLLYFLVSFLFRINRNLDIEHNVDNVIAPINGKIVKVDKDKHTIVIKKAFFQKIDVRNPSSKHPINLKFSGKHYQIGKKTLLTAELIGILIFAGNCSVQVPSEFDISVLQDDFVVAGVTKIAGLK